MAVRRIFARFWPYARPYRWQLGAALLLSVASPVLQAVTIWMFKVLTDRVLVPKDLSAFWPVAGAYAGITIAVGAVGFGRSYLSRWLAQHFALDLRTDLFAHLHTLSIDVLGSRRLGDVLSRLTSDVNAVRRLVVSGVTNTVSNALRVVLFTAALFWLQWQLAVIGLVVAPAFAVVARIFAVRIKAASREARHRNGAMTSVAEESLGNAPLVQAYQQQSGEVGRFLHQGWQKLAARLRAARLSAAFGPAVQVLELIGVLAVVGFGTWRMAAGALSLGGLLAFVGFLSQLYSPVRSLSRLANTVFSASAGAERIIDLQNMSSSVPDTGTRDITAAGNVEFERVAFSYDHSDRFALHEVSLTARPGEVLAITGPSGAGKTTIAKLLARLHDVCSGSVRVDGIDVRDIKLDALRRNVSLLLQETLVFHGSIYDNIAYGRPDATVEEVHAAARDAEVEPFATRLPDGYNTMVGERGRSLSGGQRQRIAIARALVRDAPILVLDEPSAGLDDDTSQAVLTALDRVMTGRTTIIIAHDDRSRALADRTLQMDRGHLITLERRGNAGDSTGNGPAEDSLIAGGATVHDTHG